MANVWENAISILAGNLNSGRKPYNNCKSDCNSSAMNWKATLISSKNVHLDFITPHLLKFFLKVKKHFSTIRYKFIRWLRECSIKVKVLGLHPAHMFLPPQTYLLCKSNDESKVQTFGEGHKSLKKSPNFLTIYWVQLSSRVSWLTLAFSEYLNFTK